jgi:hypothetical protein
MRDLLPATVRLYDSSSNIYSTNLINRFHNLSTNGAMMQALKFALFSMLLVSSRAQQYDYNEQGEYGQDYDQDNLYHDYAMKQQEKEGVAG